MRSGLSRSHHFALTGQEAMAPIAYSLAASLLIAKQVAGAPDFTAEVAHRLVVACAACPIKGGADMSARCSADS